MSKFQDRAGYSTLIAGALFLLTLLSFQASASEPSSCPEAFDSNGRVIVSGAICDEDILWNSFNLLTGNIASYSTEAERIINDAFLISTPVYGNTVSFYLGLVPQVNTALTEFAFIIFIILCSIYGLVRGLDVMRYGGLESKRQTFADVVWIFVVGALIYRVDGVSTVAQLGLLYAVLVAIGFANYLYSLILSYSLVGDATHNAEPWSTSGEFIDDGTVFAANLVAIVGAGQEQALYRNFHNVVTKDASMLKEAEGGGGWLASGWAAVLRLFKDSYEYRNPTVQEVFDGLFTDSTLVVSQKALSSGSPNPQVTFELSDAVYNDKGEFLIKNFQQNLGLRDLFTQRNVGTFSATSPDIDIGIVREIAQSGKIEQIFENTFDVASLATDAEKDELAKVSGKLILDIINHYVALNPSLPEEAVAEVVQNFLLGAVSLTHPVSVATTTNNPLYPSVAANALPTSKKSIQPYDVNQLNSLEGREILPYLLAQAMEATREFKSYLCYSNLPQADWEIDLFSKISSDNKGGMSKEFTSLSDVPYPFPVCSYPLGSGDYSLLIEPNDKNELFELANGLRGGESKITLREALEQSKLHFEPSKLEALDRARQSVAVIAEYYARVGAATRWALLEHKKLTQEDADLKALRSLRIAGVMKVVESMFITMRKQERYQEAFDSKITASASAHVNNDGYMTRRQLKSEYSHYSDVVSENSFAWALSRQIQDSKYGSGVHVTDVLPDDELTPTESTGFLWFVRWLSEAVIPGTDTLKYGFGFSEDVTLNDSIEQCSTVTNCVNFRMHPLAVLQQIGYEMISVAMLAEVINATIQGIELAATKMFYGDDKEDSDQKEKQGFKAKLSESLDTIASAGKGLVANVGPVKLGLAAIKLLAAFSAAVVVMTRLLLVVGVFIGIIFTLLISFTFIKRFMMAAMNAVVMLLMVNVYSVLTLFKIGDHAVIKREGVIKDFIRVIAEPPLITLSCVVFIVTSYASGYAVLSMVDSLFLADRGAASNVINSFVAEMMMPVLFLVLVVSMAKVTLTYSENLPNQVLSKAGIDLEKADGGSTLAQMVGAAAMSRPVQDIGQTLSGSFGRRTAEIKKTRDYANQKAKADASLRNDDLPPPPPPPPAQGQAAQPPAQGQAAQPPAQGKATQPPAQGQAAQPPAQGQAAQPPAQGS